MKKISAKNLVDFRKKQERAKRAFVEKIKSNKVETPTDSGGDYWVSSFSAICNSYKEERLEIIDNKAQELQEKAVSSKRTITKNMYQQNISVLENYKKLSIRKIRPLGKLPFLKKSTANKLLNIKGLDIESKPSHVYTFGKKGEEKIGAIWFIIKKDGYRIDEVGLFCDILYRFLKHNYAKKISTISKALHCSRYVQQ